MAGPVSQRSKKENKFSSTQAYSSLQNPSSKLAASSGKVLVTAKDLITPKSERVNVQAQAKPSYTQDNSRSRSRSAERAPAKTFMKHPQDDAPSTFHGASDSLSSKYTSNHLKKFMQDDSTPTGKPLSKAGATNSYLNRVFNASSSKQDSQSAYTVEEPSKRSVQFKESARGEMEHVV